MLLFNTARLPLLCVVIIPLLAKLIRLHSLTCSIFSTLYCSPSLSLPLYLSPSLCPSLSISLHRSPSLSISHSTRSIPWCVVPLWAPCVCSLCCSTCWITLASSGLTCMWWPSSSPGVRSWTMCLSLGWALPLSSEVRHAGQTCRTHTVHPGSHSHNTQRYSDVTVRPYAVQCTAHSCSTFTQYLNSLLFLLYSHMQ